jgi:hypothetical protein
MFLSANDHAFSGGGQAPIDLAREADTQQELRVMVVARAARRSATHDGAGYWHVCTRDGAGAREHRVSESAVNVLCELQNAE